MADSGGTAKSAVPRATPSTQTEIRNQISAKGWWFDLPQSDLSSALLSDADARLDAEFYTSESVAAKELLGAKGLNSEPLAAFARLYVLPRFKRVYASDPAHGAPYLSASEAFMFRPESHRFLAREYFPDKAESDFGNFAKAGWILVSTSGSVGRPLLATKRLERFILTHDLARVIVRRDAGFEAGFVYAFLASSLGGAILRQSKYGATVRHLEPSHIQSIRVPQIAGAEQKAIHDQIVHAYSLRDKANRLLDEAEAEFHKETGLPKFDPTSAQFLSLPPSRQFGEWDYPGPSAFEMGSDALLGCLSAASFHPVLKAVLKALEKCRVSILPLGPGVDRCIVAPRFARIYVRPGQGVPFLQGSDIPSIRPFLLKYLSKATPRIERWRIKKGWVLVTCSGTIGETALVPSSQDGWTASQHILRVVPKTGDGFHPGYLATFLMTPYGKTQLISYGAVVQELTAATMAGVSVPNAPADVQRNIGKKTVEAFELKAEAQKIEDEAVSTTEEAIRNRAARKA